MRLQAKEINLRSKDENAIFVQLGVCTKFAFTSFGSLAFTSFERFESRKVLVPLTVTFDETNRYDTAYGP